LNLFTLESAFGSWDKVAKEHFVDGAQFDQIYTKE
jgi:sulfate transport system substrate-binding protein